MWQGQEDLRKVLSQWLCDQPRLAVVTARVMAAGDGGSFKRAWLLRTANRLCFRLIFIIFFTPESFMHTTFLFTSMWKRLAWFPGAILGAPGHDRWTWLWWCGVMGDAMLPRACKLNNLPCETLSLPLPPTSPVNGLELSADELRINICFYQQCCWKRKVVGAGRGWLRERRTTSEDRKNAGRRTKIPELGFHLYFRPTQLSSILVWCMKAGRWWSHLGRRGEGDGSTGRWRGVRRSPQSHLFSSVE